MKYSENISRLHREKIKEIILGDSGVSSNYVCRELARRNLKLGRNYVAKLVKQAAQEIAEEKRNLRDAKERNLPSLVEQYNILILTHDGIEKNLRDLKLVIRELSEELPIEHRKSFW